MGRKKLPRIKLQCCNCGEMFEVPRYQVTPSRSFCSRACLDNMTHGKNLVRYGWDVTPSGCWEYRGSRNKAGDGVVAAQYELRLAHRVAWEEKNNRPIPDGLLALHSCDNPPCVNPDHLFIGTHQDNVADKCRKGRLGTPPQGEAHRSAKLTEEIVCRIRKIPHSVINHKDLADQYGVSANVISAVRNRKSWRHVD